MKKKVKVWKHLRIDIERVVEQTTDNGVTENKTLHYLINAMYSGKQGVGFRADTPIECWSKLMHEVNLY
jgi:hypothetical protein